MDEQVIHIIYPPSLLKKPIINDLIRKYQQLKTNLNLELGLEPAPEITKLFYQLCGSQAGIRKLKKA